MEKIIIYYLIGLLVAYFAVGIFNKFTKPLSSWVIFGSWLTVINLLFWLGFYYVGLFLGFIYVLIENFLTFLWYVSYKKLLTQLFKFIIKFPLNVVKWVINIFKKLHFLLIPPEKGIDLIINLFKKIGGFFVELGFLGCMGLLGIILMFFGVIICFVYPIGFIMIICGLVLFMVAVLTVLIFNDGSDY